MFACAQHYSGYLGGGATMVGASKLINDFQFVIIAYASAAAESPKPYVRAPISTSSPPDECAAGTPPLVADLPWLET